MGVGDLVQSLTLVTGTSGVRNHLARVNDQLETRGQSEREHVPI